MIPTTIIVKTMLHIKFNIHIRYAKIKKLKSIRDCIALLFRFLNIM